MTTILVLESCQTHTGSLYHNLSFRQIIACNICEHMLPCPCTCDCTISTSSPSPVQPPPISYQIVWSKPTLKSLQLHPLATSLLYTLFHHQKVQIVSLTLQ